jgi:hypothetical protein
MIGSGVELINLVIAFLGMSPHELFVFGMHHRISSAVILALSSATAMSTGTSRFFGFSLRDMIYIALRFAYYLPLTPFRGKAILVMCDADEHNVIAKKFSQKLEAALKGSHLRSRIIVLSSGTAIVGFPLLPLLIRSVLVIITDVSQLSAEGKRRALIQKSLIKYTKAGGMLLLYHDVLYRRTRNDQLQSFAGGKITRFTICPIVHYEKYTSDAANDASSGEHIAYNPPSSNIALMAELPAHFALADK